MQNIIGLVHLVLVIFAIMDCFKTVTDTTKKVIWVLVILLVPIIGPILYFVLGKK